MSVQLLWEQGWYLQDSHIPEILRIRLQVVEDQGSTLEPTMLFAQERQGQVLCPQLFGH